MIIDDKGRLFGKLNIIDAMFICAAVFFAVMMFHGWKMWKKTSDKVTITLGEFEKLKDTARITQELRDEIDLMKEQRAKVRDKMRKMFRREPRTKRYFKEIIRGW